MNIQLIGINAGLVIGLSWSGLVAAYLFFTRTARGAHNQYVIRLGQLLVGALGIGSLLLLSKVSEQSSLLAHSPSFDTSLYAFLLSSACVLFFAMRAEIRWRKLSGLDRTSANPDNRQRLPTTPAGRRKLVSLLLLGLVCLGSSAGFLARWPRPVSLYLEAASCLGLFAILVMLTTARDRTYAVQLQKLMLVAFLVFEIAMLALFWKFRDSSPAFSSAAMIAAVMLCVGATAALLAMRRIMPRP